LAEDMNFDHGSEDDSCCLAACNEVAQELCREVFWKDQESGTTINNSLAEAAVGGP
jgi:hypothetical protein